MRRATLQQLAGHRARHRPRHGEARPRHLFEETLQHGRHAAQPQRIDDDEVLRPRDVPLRRLERCRHRAIVPLGLALEQRELDARDLQQPDLVTRRAGRFGIGLGQCMAEVPGRCIGVALQNQDAFAHARILAASI